MKKYRVFLLTQIQLQLNRPCHKISKIKKVEKTKVIIPTLIFQLFNPSTLSLRKQTTLNFITLGLRQQVTFYFTNFKLSTYP